MFTNNSMPKSESPADKIVNFTAETLKFIKAKLGTFKQGAPESTRSEQHRAKMSLKEKTDSIWVGLRNITAKVMPSSWRQAGAATLLGVILVLQGADEAKAQKFVDLTTGDKVELLAALSAAQERTVQTLLLTSETPGVQAGMKAIGEQLPSDVATLKTYVEARFSENNPDARKQSEANQKLIQYEIDTISGMASSQGISIEKATVEYLEGVVAELKDAGRPVSPKGEAAIQASLNTFNPANIVAPTSIAPTPQPTPTVLPSTQPPKSTIVNPTGAPQIKTSPSVTQPKDSVKPGSIKNPEVNPPLTEEQKNINKNKQLLSWNGSLESGSLPTGSVSDTHTYIGPKMDGSGEMTVAALDEKSQVVRNQLGDLLKSEQIDSSTSEKARNAIVKTFKLKKPTSDLSMYIDALFGALAQPTPIDPVKMAKFKKTLDDYQDKIAAEILSIQRTQGVGKNSENSGNAVLGSGLLLSGGAALALSLLKRKREEEKKELEGLESVDSFIANDYQPDQKVAVKMTDGRVLYGKVVVDGAGTKFVSVRIIGLRRESYKLLEKGKKIGDQDKTDIINLIYVYPKPQKVVEKQKPIEPSASQAKTPEHVENLDSINSNDYKEGDRFEIKTHLGKMLIAEVIQDFIAGKVIKIGDNRLAIISKSKPIYELSELGTVKTITKIDRDENQELIQKYGFDSSIFDGGDNSSWDIIDSSESMSYEELAAGILEAKTPQKFAYLVQETCNIIYNRGKDTPLAKRMMSEGEAKQQEHIAAYVGHLLVAHFGDWTNSDNKYVKQLLEEIKPILIRYGWKNDDLESGIKHDLMEPNANSSQVGKAICEVLNEWHNQDTSSKPPVDKSNSASNWTQIELPKTTPVSIGQESSPSTPKVELENRTTPPRSQAQSESASSSETLPDYQKVLESLYSILIGGLNFDSNSANLSKISEATHSMLQLNQILSKSRVIFANVIEIIKSVNILLKSNVGSIQAGMIYKPVSIPSALPNNSENISLNNQINQANTEDIQSLKAAESLWNSLFVILQPNFDITYQSDPQDSRKFIATITKK